jgi:medium-chain acyl-[acyl-carrier-protein] hydrolase
MRKKIKLFCFPYAGGSADVFSKWKPYLEAGVELVPVELAGRGKRILEPLYKDIQDAMDDVYRIVTDEISRTQAQYAFFGHSMGCKIAYQLAQKISNTDMKQPQHIFFSGRLAPHFRRERKKTYHLMEDSEFAKEVVALGGTPPELFRSQELMDLFLPVLKNDFKMVETDIPGNGEISPLHYDISVFLGKEDNLTDEGCNGWYQHTSKNCNIHYFDGGHFFLNDKAPKLVSLINAALLYN